MGTQPSKQPRDGTTRPNRRDPSKVEVWFRDGWYDPECLPTDGALAYVQEQKRNHDHEAASHH